MFRNYVLIAIRSIQKSGVYSFINIFGLSIGITCAILIMLWVADEFSWDNFHLKKDRLYRVYVTGKGDNGLYTQMAIPLPLWDALKDGQTGINHVSPTNWGSTHLISVGDTRLYKRSYYAGDEFLRMFTFPVIHGSQENLLSDPSTIVLTRSAANSLFGFTDVVGKTVRVDDRRDLTVSAVIEDVPSNSTFKFDCLMPFTTYMLAEPWVKNAREQWGNYSFNLYAEFDSGADPADVEQRVKDIIRKNSDDDVDVTFLPMARWRLYSDFKNGKSVGGMILYVRMFAIIAAFILFIACINFTNLATARSEKRAREVGIRKSIGSRRKELVMQFMGETLTVSLFAFILSIGMVEVSLPFYNSLVGKELAIQYGNPMWYAIAFVVILTTGMLAGSYPALYLSSFLPAQVLKGKPQTGRRGSLPRKILVTLQFFFSIALIVGTGVIYFQIDHLRKRPTGYESGNLLYVPSTGEIGKNIDLIRNDLVGGGIVESVTTSSSPITAIYAFTGDVNWPGKREDQRPSFASVAVGPDYCKTMRITIKEGRDFSPEFADSSSVIFNEAAIAYMGLVDPIGQRINFRGQDRTIVGVVEDVIMISPSRSVDPTGFIYDPSWASDVTVRLHADKGPIESLPRIEEVFRKHNPSYPFVYYFVDQEFDQKFAGIKRIGNLANLFSILAVVISCLGLFGLAAYMAEQRTKEIGIRKVLGASVANLVTLITRDFTVLIVIAFTLAAPLASWVMDEWLAQYDYRVRIEWWIPATAGAATLLIALIVVSAQAIKAAVSNPVKALRSE